VTIKEQVEQVIREYITGMDEHVLLEEDVVRLAERIASIIVSSVIHSLSSECVWILIEEGKYITACGRDIVFDDTRSLAEQGLVWCCCGKKLTEMRQKT